MLCLPHSLVRVGHHGDQHIHQQQSGHDHVDQEKGLEKKK